MRRATALASIAGQTQGPERVSVFKDHFSKVAQEYAQSRPDYPGALFDYLAGLCAARRLAWDCACGSGQATLALAERFEQVVGTDASAQQLAAAPAHARVQYRVAAAEDSGLASGSADLITVAQALHWFDLPRFYAEAQRVLKPDACLAVWTYGNMRMADADIDAVVGQFARDVVGPYWPPERRLVDSGYRALPFPFAELEPPAFVMEQRWTLARLLGYFGSWSATVRYVAATGHDPIAELGARLAAAWGDTQAPRLIIWPLSLRVGRRA
jgi:SAM-dependent methyltransferase